MLDFKKVCTLRREQDLTQECIAAQMEISPTTYARIERGEIQPKIEKLQQLAQILKVDVNELLEHEDKSVLLSVNGSSDFSNSPHQAGWNFYHNHNNYYGNDALAAEIDKLKRELQHEKEKVLLLQKETAFLKDLLQNKNTD